MVKYFLLRYEARYSISKGNIVKIRLKLKRNRRTTVVQVATQPTLTHRHRYEGDLGGAYVFGYFPFDPMGLEAEKVTDTAASASSDVSNEDFARMMSATEPGSGCASPASTSVDSDDGTFGSFNQPDPTSTPYSDPGTSSPSWSSGGSFGDGGSGSGFIG